MSKDQPELSDMFKEMARGIPWYFKLLWACGVLLSLTVIGAIIYLLFKIASRL